MSVLGSQVFRQALMNSCVGPEADSIYKLPYPSICLSVFCLSPCNSEIDWNGDFCLKRLFLQSLKLYEDRVSVHTATLD